LPVRAVRHRHAHRGPPADAGAARPAGAERGALADRRRDGGGAAMSTATLDRSLVERLVREALAARANGRDGQAGAPRLVGNVSARHCHVTQQDLETLFGKGHTLTPYKALYQDGFFAAEETVTMIGPRHRMITNLRILGPCRDHSQVELAFTDAVMLGLDVPV